MPLLPQSVLHPSCSPFLFQDSSLLCLHLFKCPHYFIPPLIILSPVLFLLHHSITPKASSASPFPFHYLPACLSPVAADENGARWQNQGPRGRSLRRQSWPGLAPGRFYWLSNSGSKQSSCKWWCSQTVGCCHRAPTPPGTYRWEEQQGKCRLGVFFFHTSLFILLFFQAEAVSQLILVELMCKNIFFELNLKLADTVCTFSLCV